MNGNVVGIPELMSGISMLGFIIVSWILSVRLLLLWRSTRGLPELSLAILYLAIGAVGYPLAALGTNPPSGMGVDLTRVVMLCGMTMVRAGVAAAFFFTWHAFRPGEAWAKWLSFAGARALRVRFYRPLLSVLQETDRGAIAAATGDDGIITTILLSAIAFTWASIESIHHYSMTRRRLALGLTDPVVVNRLLRWGIVTTSSAVVNFMTLGVIMAGLNPFENGAALIASALSGVINSTLLILAFVPPPAYLRMIRRQAQASTTS
jgi:hypothetical protein